MSPEKSPQSKLAKKSAKGNSSPVDSVTVNEPHQVVSFRCTPVTRSSENLIDDMPDRETFTLETPFVFKEV